RMFVLFQLWILKPSPRCWKKETLMSFVCTTTTSGISRTKSDFPVVTLVPAREMELPRHTGIFVR
ncbi:hypothetical protein BG015_011911, partial [Linnemannia schmuckeri]